MGRMEAKLVGNAQDPFVPISKVRKLPFMVGRPTFEAVQESYLRVASVVFADEATAEALTANWKPKAKAAVSDEERIAELLDDGANPEARDGKGRVPYYLCPSNKSREAFRRWRGDNEESWNWGAAQVPEGITEESEQKKKDKEKEKKKRQKEKQKAAKAQFAAEEEERRKKEEEEVRALEAAQTKCDSCKKGITSKPFPRLSYMYCSTDCVNAHRRALQAEAAEKRFGS